MSERAIFLDRDDTIIDNDGYLGDPAPELKLLPGAATALASMRALGYRLIVVSNQSGVARGMFTEDAVQAVNDEMSRQLREKGGAYVDASYYCPFHPEAIVQEYRADHEWRKPKPGMILQAARDFKLDLSQSWMVGDMARDIESGAAAGCRTILLKDPDLKKGRGGGITPKDESSVTPNFVVKTLADAARIIVREGPNPPPAAPVPPPPAVPRVSAAPAPMPPTPVDSSPVSTSTGTSGSPAGSPSKIAAAPAVSPSPIAAASSAAAVMEREEEEIEMPRVQPLADTRRVPIARAEPAVETKIVTEVKTERQAVTTPAAISTGNGSPAARDTSQMEKNLDELIIQLRQQNRNADLRPDFSLGNMAAIILQMLALGSLVFGLFRMISQKATFVTQGDVEFAILGNLQAMTWIMAAFVLQGVVIALLVHGRSKQ